MKRILLSAALGVAGVCASAGAFAHTDVGVYFGVPGPVYEAPPPVYYGPYYGDGYRREWHDNGRHRGWRHHHRDDDD